MSLRKKTSQKKLQDMTEGERSNLEAIFFKKVSLEVKKLNEEVKDDQVMTRLLGMTSAYALKTFIPGQLRNLDSLRTNQEKYIKNIKKVSHDLQNLLDASNVVVDDVGYKNEYAHKLKTALGNQMASKEVAHQTLDDLINNVASCHLENERFNEVADEIYNLICVLFGIIKLKKFIRYSIKRVDGQFNKVDVYRWVDIKDVRNYDRQRWHYSIDFLAENIYVRRDDGKVMFKGGFDEFINKLNRFR